MAEIGDVFELGDTGTYPLRRAFERAEREHGMTLGPMRRSTEQTAMGTLYCCAATVIAVDERAT